MPSFVEFLEYVGIKERKPKMSSEFKPTTIVQHRYEEVTVLEKCLKDFGYKPKEWRISDKNRPGIQIQLPNGQKLTDEQVKTVHAAYVKHNEDKRRRNKIEDGE